MKVFSKGDVSKNTCHTQCLTMSLDKWFVWKSSSPPMSIWCCIIKRWKEKQNQNQNLISDIIMSSLKGKRSGFHSICKCTRDIVPTKVLIPIPGFITIVSNRLPSILLHFKCSMESQGFTLIWVTIETVLMLQNNRHFEFHSTTNVGVKLCQNDTDCQLLTHW